MYVNTVPTSMDLRREFPNNDWKRMDLSISYLVFSPLCFSVSLFSLQPFPPTLLVQAFLSFQICFSFLMLLFRKHFKKKIPICTSAQISLLETQKWRDRFSEIQTKWIRNFAKSSAWVSPTLLPSSPSPLKKNWVKGLSMLCRSMMYWCTYPWKKYIAHIVMRCSMIVIIPRLFPSLS